MFTFSTRIIFSILLIIFSFKTLMGQKDTAFWFVAPEVSQSVSDYDRPVFLKFSTYDAPAVITVTQPANPNFPSMTLNLNAGTTGELDLTLYIDMVENKPANQVLDYGFYISATTAVSGYYEILGDCQCNPEICSLKGRHALGTTFYVPFQNYLSNGNATDPAKAAFDIVASADNTQITIVPTANLVGHPANVPFSINLDKGNTYSCVAQGTAAAAHPGGTKVTSDKPIAITMKDDLLNGGAFYGGSCLDLVSDQLVPVSTLGNRYVVMKGELDGVEKAFVVATANNTSIQVDGALAGTINEGATFSVDITGYHFIEASEPVYLLQVTGIGCETSGEILPSMDCTGSTAVRFIRSTPEIFDLFIITRDGFQDAFTLNGNAGIINSADFAPIPGSAGEFVGATIAFSDNTVPADQSILVENSEGLFHLGFLNGNVSVTGSRFGFFSDYQIADTIEQQYFMCQGDSVLVNGVYRYDFGNYYSTVALQPGCDQTLALEVLPAGYLYIDSVAELCAGDTFFINNHLYVNNGTYVDTLASSAACDTIFTTQLVFQDYIHRSESISLCMGDTLFFNGVPIASSGVYTDTISGGVHCDTIAVLDIQFNFISLEKDISICIGDTFYVNQLPVLMAGTYIDTLKSEASCDTIVTINLSFFEVMEDFIQPADTFICPGQQIQLTSDYENTIWGDSLAGILIDINEPDSVYALARNGQGCFVKDTAVVRPCCNADLIFFPNAFSPNNDQVNDLFCPFSGDFCHAISFKVFNRWGELIFDSVANGMCWDGTFRSQQCPIEVYAWFAEIVDNEGNSSILKGDVTLIR